MTDIARTELMFREARVTDASAILDLVTEAIGSAAGLHYTPQELDDWQGRFRVHVLQERLALGERDCIVAEAQGAIVAMGARKGHVIEHLFVHPGANGQGLASRLLGELEGRAFRDGHRLLVLEASRNAVGFYRRHDYRDTITPGCDTICRRMEKVITDQSDVKSASNDRPIVS